MSHPRDWGIWDYQADITNGAGGAGDNSYTITVPVGAVLEIEYGELFNGDTSNRTAVIEIRGDGGERLATLINGTLNAAARSSFPSANIFAAAGNPLGTSARIFVSGGMDIVAAVLAVAASQDTAFGISCRIWGEVPTVVEAGASTPTINVNLEKVF